MKVQRILDPLGSALGGSQTGFDYEYIDTMIVNAQGATITLGNAACYTTTTASNDGRLAVLPAAANAATFAGIAMRDIPNNGMGRVRSYGFCNSVLIFSTGTSGTNGAGIAMGVGVVGSLGINSTGLKDFMGPVVSMEAIGAAVNSPGGYAKGFVRSL